MDRIIREAEASIGTFLHPHSERAWDVAETTAELICHGAEELPMSVIAVFTETGSTARLISRHRPRPPIIAFTPLAGDAPPIGIALGRGAAKHRTRSKHG